MNPSQFDSVRERTADERLAAITTAASGSHLSKEEAVALEDACRADPANVAARIQLLGFLLVRQFHDPALMDNRRRHVLWFIETMPKHAICFTPYTRLDSDPVGYAAGKRLWLVLVRANPGSRRILENAAWFLSTNDESDAINLLTRAEELDED